MTSSLSWVLTCSHAVTVTTYLHTHPDREAVNRCLVKDVSTARTVGPASVRVFEGFTWKNKCGSCRFKLFRIWSNSRGEKKRQQTSCKRRRGRPSVSLEIMLTWLVFFFLISNFKTITLKKIQTYILYQEALCTSPLPFRCSSASRLLRSINVTFIYSDGKK